MGKELAATMRGLIANAHDIGINGPALPRLFQKIGAELIAAVALPFLVLTLAALAGNIIQHRLTWSFETVKPKLSKISPAAGLKRIFSKQSLANLGKGLVKVVLVGGVLIAADVAPTRTARSAYPQRSVSDPAVIPVSDSQAPGRGGCNARRCGGR